MIMDAVKRVTYSEFLEFELQDTVSENVKRFIAASGYTGEELAMRTNLSIATISRLKAGQNLTIRSICALAEALNKQPEAFFVRKEKAD